MLIIGLEKSKFDESKYKYSNGQTTDLGTGFIELKSICENRCFSSAFCGSQRTQMRFRADAMRNITDASKRLILLFSSSVGSLLCSALLPA